MEANIASAIDVVVQTARGRDGTRYVSHIAELEFDQERRRCVCVPLFSRDPLEPRGRWRRVPLWVDQVADWGIGSGKEVERWKAMARCS